MTFKENLIAAFVTLVLFFSILFIGQGITGSFIIELPSNQSYSIFSGILILIIFLLFVVVLGGKFVDKKNKKKINKFFGSLFR